MALSPNAGGFKIPPPKKIESPQPLTPNEQSEIANKAADKVTKKEKAAPQPTQKFQYQPTKWRA